MPEPVGPRMSNEAGRGRTPTGAEARAAAAPARPAYESGDAAPRETRRRGRRTNPEVPLRGRSPDGRDEPRHPRKERALEGIAAELARRRLRGHVYRTEEGTAVFASTAPDDGRTLPENRGPEPVLEAIRKHVGDEPDPWAWIAGLWRPDPIANGVPHPTVYDGPNLLVTGTSAKIAAGASPERHPSSFGTVQRPIVFTGR